ncbi:MAG: type I DNA topoisomerase [Spirochaetales bacterium]|uniref:DNA topoisomerase 1 n=1 Tax=Candidatus Thalassospirochaeta sargassi TaxID=3119039 RepID=A0AAJ1IIJ6_9SPIO|nr:type I DNA topoisomerase [Spirochaetales bacterium]
MKVHTLLIVESPAKASTIERYLGPGYTVLASMGHLIDLPKSRIAIDEKNNFEPEYITVRGKAKILKELQTNANKAGHVLLASDNDREGEAIAYHLKNSLLKKNEKLEIERIVFNEITPTAIKEAVANPMEINEPKVNAQKARRVLDRLVGYNLSPLLWSKVKNGLSAGRVQSVALRLICEREKLVESFIPEEYWTLDAEFKKGKTSFAAQMVQYKGKKVDIKDEKEVERIINELKDVKPEITSVKGTEKQIKPRAPFTTSTLQQMSANRLGFTSRKTMQIAQQLYEGINIDSSRVGLITYMRTDSTRISDQAIEEVRDWINTNHPDALPEKPASYSVKKSAQDAHEAIRPTYIRYTPDEMKQYLNKDQFKLYSIIWERFVACQMINAKTLTTSVEITIKDAVFRVSSTKAVVKGFQSVIKMLKSKEKTAKVPALKEGDNLEANDFNANQHFTTGPSRFTDASIVKMLEENGIGRPSTYAPIIGVLLDRYYVVRRNKQLQPTTLGKIISDMLSTQFPKVVSQEFTVEMERNLDRVETEGLEWHEMIGKFYAPFKKQVEHVNETMESIKGVLDEPTDEVCEKCGMPMVKKLGRFGFFLACSGFPDCRNTKAVPLADCPREGCDGKIVARKKAGGKGKEFYGCTNYPECDFISHFKPTSSKCPHCGYFLVEKSDKKTGTVKACINPECDFLHTHEQEEAEKARVEKEKEPEAAK